jgi:glutamate synthase (ferredoxin)
MTGGIVINLGTTGRNVAAGMSGGVAYFYDEEDDLVRHSLNPAMVNVYKLIECRDSEINFVKARIEKHVTLTSSKRGQSILNNWESASAKFLKIMPQDYERVLEAQERAKERGLKGDDAILAAFEENVKAGH